MTNLSPAAQAVLQAACIHHGLFNEEIVQRRRNIVAALRALTDQVMPERPLWSRRGAELTLYHEGRLDAAIRFRAEILTIAAELEGAQ